MHQLKQAVTVTPEAKKFTKWYRSLQKENWTEVSRHARREATKKDLYQPMGWHLTAARILQSAGRNIDRAEAMTRYAIESPKYRSKALQSLEDLAAIVRTESFINDFKSESTVILGLPPLPVTVTERAMKNGLLHRKRLAELKQLRREIAMMSPSEKEANRIQILVRLMSLAKGLGVAEDEWDVTVLEPFRYKPPDFPKERYAAKYQTTWELIGIKPCFTKRTRKEDK